MKKVLLSLALTITGFAYGQLNVPLYSTEVFSDDLYMIDTSTFTVTSTTTLTSGLGVSGINGADIDPCTGTVYVNYKDGGSTRRLGTLDPATGVITDIGPFGDQVSTISFGPTGLLFAITGNGAGTTETLYQVDIGTGAMTLITPLSAEDDGEALGFNPDNGMLYRWSGWSNVDCIMEEIDPSTFTATAVPLSGYAYDNVAGATYIGNNTFIGPFVEIQKDVTIGERCKIQSHSFICELVTIGDNTIIAHGVMFINDKFQNNGPAKGDKTLWEETKIGNNVSIGSK